MSKTSSKLAVSMRKVKIQENKSEEKPATIADNLDDRSPAKAVKPARVPILSERVWPD